MLTLQGLVLLICSICTILYNSICISNYIYTCPLNKFEQLSSSPMQQAAHNCEKCLDEIIDAFKYGDAKSIIREDLIRNAESTASQLETIYIKSYIAHDYIPPADVRLCICIGYKIYSCSTLCGCNASLDKSLLLSIGPKIEEIATKGRESSENFINFLDSLKSTKMNPKTHKANFDKLSQTVKRVEISLMKTTGLDVSKIDRAADQLKENFDTMNKTMAKIMSGIEEECYETAETAPTWLENAKKINEEITRVGNLSSKLEESEKEILEKNEKIEKIDKENEEYKNKIQSLEERLGPAQIKIEKSSLLETELNVLKNQISFYSVQIESLQRDVDQAEQKSIEVSNELIESKKKVSDLKEQMDARARSRKAIFGDGGNTPELLGLRQIVSRLRRELAYIKGKEGRIDLESIQPALSIEPLKDEHPSVLASKIESGSGGDVEDTTQNYKNKKKSVNDKVIENDGEEVVDGEGMHPGGIGEGGEGKNAVEGGGGGGGIDERRMNNKDDLKNIKNIDNENRLKYLKRMLLIEKASTKIVDLKNKNNDIKYRKDQFNAFRLQCAYISNNIIKSMNIYNKNDESFIQFPPRDIKRYINNNDKDSKLIAKLTFPKNMNYGQGSPLTTDKGFPLTTGLGSPLTTDKITSMFPNKVSLTVGSDELLSVHRAIF
eukprot:GHVL01029914.1.p1 GENE.GHVL01029914.1~~GHVL01029914.1.p1  ORF type:complete len:764 (+),score=263.56 GHVL01029914.1:300-2294(+)